MADTSAEFAIERIFDAPRDLVWKAHSEIGHLSKWWGPKGFAWVNATLDFRPGGIFHYCMRSPDGHEMWGKFVYREVVKPERIVFVNSFSNKEGATVRAPFAPDFPLEVANTLTFSGQGGKTTLNLRGAPVNASAAELARYRATNTSMNQGFAGTFDQLAEHLTEMRSKS